MKISFFLFALLFVTQGAFAANHPSERDNPLFKIIDIGLATPHTLYSKSIEDRYSPILERFIPNDLQRKYFLSQATYEAERADIDIALVLAVTEVESRFNRYALSSAKALGYMQIMPFWPKSIGFPQHNLFNGQTNIRYGCTILKYYLQLEHGDLFLALGRYNGSRGQSAYPDAVFTALKKYN